MKKKTFTIESIIDSCGVCPCCIEGACWKDARDIEIEDINSILDDCPFLKEESKEELIESRKMHMNNSVRLQSEINTLNDILAKSLENGSVQSPSVNAWNENPK
jgi:hypothetical protein